MNKFFKAIADFLKNLKAKQDLKAAPPLKPSPLPMRGEDVSTDTAKPAYYILAEKEIGVSESKTPSRVIYYLKKWTNLGSDYWFVSTSWCAAFVSYCLGESGYKSLKTAWARDYQGLKKLTSPVIYCIMGFERNGPGGDSHVAFWTGRETSTHYEVLGGNQDNQVCFAWYRKSDVIYFVQPQKV